MSDKAGAWKSWIVTALEVFSVVTPSVLAIYFAYRMNNHFKSESNERSQRATQALYHIWQGLGVRPMTGYRAQLLFYCPDSPNLPCARY
jgi:hypothetical protein